MRAPHLRDQEEEIRSGNLSKEKEISIKLLRRGKVRVYRERKRGCYQNARSTKKGKEL